MWKLLRAAPSPVPKLAAGQPAACAGKRKGATRDSFCILAWNHLQIAPNGTVKMCCIASEDISENGQPMSLYSDSYESIWNSQYMRDARHGMAAGEEISPCKRCYQEEDTVGHSRRTQQNALWLGLYDKQPKEFIDEARSSDWKVADRPSYLQLNMGNLCNLACRMCSSQYSSRIENDPVHSKWMPAAYPDVARWRGDVLHFGPRQFFGVHYHGFYDYEVGPDYALRWTSGTGRIDFRIPDECEVRAVGLELRGRGTTPITIWLNGTELYAGKIGPQSSQRFETRASVIRLSWNSKSMRPLARLAAGCWASLW